MSSLLKHDLDIIKPENSEVKMLRGNTAGNAGAAAAATTNFFYSKNSASQWHASKAAAAAEFADFAFIIIL